MTRKQPALAIKYSNCGKTSLKPKKAWHYGPNKSVCGRVFHGWIRPTKAIIRSVATQGKTKVGLVQVDRQ
ncbi:MAG: hypothetical protein QXU75_06860 [Candidatus Methanomethylicaceae archaeon]